MPAWCSLHMWTKSEPWSFVGRDERRLVAETLPAPTLAPLNWCVPTFLVNMTETRTGWFILVPSFTAVLSSCGMRGNCGAVVKRSSSHHRRERELGEEKAPTCHPFPIMLYYQSNEKPIHNDHIVSSDNPHTYPECTPLVYFSVQLV